MLNLQVVSGYQGTVTFAGLKRLAAEALRAESLPAALEVCRDFAYGLEDDGRGTWRYYLLRMINSLETGKPYFRLFQKGNGKLPFVAWSSLPFFTCPGMGECAGFCYSVRAWRTPGGFLRQLQNTLLLKFCPDMVKAAFRRIKKDTVVRLYVDGDFSSVADVRFWFDLLRERPDIRAYGYSKSWDEIYAVCQEDGAPGNYRLNLSSGGRQRNVTIEQMRTLSCVRGEFIAVKLSKKHARGFKRYDSLDYHRDVVASARAAGIERPFSCPGKCGECCGGRHACGSDIFQGRNIVIGVH